MYLETNDNSTSERVLDLNILTCGPSIVPVLSQHPGTPACFRPSGFWLTYLPTSFQFFACSQCQIT